MNDMNKLFSQYMVEKTIQERQDEAARQNLLREAVRETPDASGRPLFPHMAKALWQAPMWLASRIRQIPIIPGARRIAS